MSDQVVVTSHGNVAEVMLNRPEHRNALSRELLEDLLDALTQVAARPDGHVLVLHGAGPGFCAGADLGMVAQLPASTSPWEAFVPSVDAFQEIVHLLATAPRLTIAAVHGFALGAGFDLALACDLRIAAAGTQFASSYVRFGLVPDGGGTWALPRLVGLGSAMAILLSGDPIDTEGAYRLGLVQRRTAIGKHLSGALAWGEELARRSLTAQVAIKRLARVAPRLTLSAALKEEKESQRRVVEDGEPFRFLDSARQGEH